MKNRMAPREPLPNAAGVENPLELVRMVGGHPLIDFYWKEVGGKRRLVGNPNKPMRLLHELFYRYLKRGTRAIPDGFGFRMLPSSAGFVKGSNPLKNALAHRRGRFFYITDIWNAYPSVDLERLAALVVYIKRHWEYSLDFSLSALGQSALYEKVLREDILFAPTHAFLQVYCGGVHGRGLAVGGPLSPYLFNLYCEVYLDCHLRRLCGQYGITYTRYADDCVFSREKPIVGELRRHIRDAVARAGFSVNHRKSRVLSREMGTVFVTKVGLRDDGATEARIVYPQWKRRRLHGIIGSYLTMQMDWPEKVGGYVAEFIYYYKTVGKPTATDQRTFALCKRFEAEWAKYKKKH